MNSKSLDWWIVLSPLVVMIIGFGAGLLTGWVFPL